MKTSKKLFAILLALCLFCSLSLPAFAVNAQYGTTKSFLKVMDRDKFKYSYMGINSSDDEQVNVSFTGKNTDSVDVKIFFDEDLDSVSMRCWNVINFNKKDLAAVLSLVNKLNNDYKYVKFVVDETEYSVDAELDSPLRDDANAGEIAFDGVYYIVKIVDDAYPELKPFAVK